MPEANKDPAIKLFGRTISLSRHNTEVSANDSPYDDDHSTPSPSSSDPRKVSYETQHETEKDKEPSRKKHTSLQDDEASNQTIEDPKSPTSSSGLFENTKTPSTETEKSIEKFSNNNNNGPQSETCVSKQDKTSPKKPEKILPCPRCSNMDTKFCYFNNYNVNQPRHFCKNCQRYWTAGGTMRNVPVGAGRRKNKNTSCSNSFSCASSYHQVIVPEALQRGISDHSLCDSVASVLSLAEKTEQNGVKIVFHAPKQKYTFVTPTSSDKNRGYSGSHEFVGKGYQCNFPPWPYPWNTAMHPPHALCQPGYPVPFYATPTHYFATPQSCVDHFAHSAGPNLPTLGKHSREGNMLPPISSRKDKVATENSNKLENGVVMIPKTLRIDDPGEAAMSSEWSTLRIKNDKAKNLGGGGIFKAFPTKGNDNKFHVVEASPVLQANPAALSRSLIFHERT